MLYDKCDSAAGIKTSCGVKVRALWEVLRGKRNGCNGVDLAPETKTQLKECIHGFQNNDGDR